VVGDVRHGSVKRVASGAVRAPWSYNSCTSIWPKCSDPVAGKVQSEFGKAAKRMTELADKARVEALIPALRKVPAFADLLKMTSNG